MFLHIISISKAKSLGMKTYFTGKPCAKGHVSERRIDSGCLECSRNKCRRYRASNKDAVAATNKKWSENNPERKKELRSRWLKENAEHVRSYEARYREENRPAVNAKNANRRAIVAACEGSFTHGEIQSKIKLQRKKCANCKKKLDDKYHIDHVMPISKGGSNYISNIEILCAGCNLSKNAKLPDQWAKENGRLL